MAVRLKVRCDEAVLRKVSAFYSTKDKSGKLAEIRLRPVTGGSPENEAFFNSTPGGEVEFQAINAAILDEFEVGREYYVTIEPAVAQ